MPYWLKRLLIWKGHILLWSAALIGLLWLLLAVGLSYIGNRPASLYQLAAMAGVQLEIGRFEANTRPLSLAIDFSLDNLHLAWDGGGVAVAHIDGDIYLSSLLWPDLSVGHHLFVDTLNLVLQTDPEHAEGLNPVANHWLRLWEDTQVKNASLTWQAEQPWLLDNIQLQLNRQQQWQANAAGIMHYPGWQAVPVQAHATISHTFGFHPRVAFDATAVPGDMSLLGRPYHLDLGLHGKWQAEGLNADVTINAAGVANGGERQQQVIGHVETKDLLTWSLVMQKMLINNQDVALPSPPMLTLNPQTGATLTINQLTLNADGQWLDAMPTDVQQQWQHHQPQLGLNQLTVHWAVDGNIDRIHGDVDALRWAATDTLPGLALSKLTLDYLAQSRVLQLAFDGDNQLFWPSDSRPPVLITAAPLRLQLNAEQDIADIASWQVELGKVHAKLAGRVDTHNPMQLQLGLTADELTDVVDLFPMEAFSPALQRWLKMALVSGKDIQASVRFNGLLDALLAGQLNDDNFSLSATTTDASLLYDKDYPPLTHADGHLYVHDHALIIESQQGLISGGGVKQIKAEILYLPNNQVALRLNGKMRSDLSHAKSFLLSSPLARLLDVVTVLKETQLSGSATGQLSLWLPLDGFDAADSEPRIRGMVATDDAKLGYGSLHLDAVGGRLLFSELGIDSPQLTGRWHDGALQSQLSSLDRDHIRLRLTGKTSIQQAHLADGAVEWQSEIMIRRSGALEIQASGHQANLALLLPTPLAKPKGKDSPWQLQASFADNRLQVHVSDSRWQADADLKQNKERWQLTTLSFAPLGAKKGDQQAAVTIQLPQLSLTEWLDWYAQLDDGDSSLILPSEGHLSVTTAQVAGQNISGLETSWQTREPHTGNITLSAKHLDGVFSWTQQDMTLHLKQAHWLRRVKLAAEKLQEPIPVCAVPNQQQWRPLTVDIDRLDLETVGEDGRFTTPLTQVHARVSQDGLLRKASDIQFGYKSLKGHGDWQWDINHNQSRLHIATRADHAEDLMALWGSEKVIAGGSIDSDLNVGWAGGFDCFDTRLLQGDMYLRADDGALSETSPGLARLFGLLSFDAFTRRLKIGLGDVVNKGLAYDKIEVNTTLAHGLLNVNRLQLDGPSVQMKLKGITDLIAEEHDLTAEVTPLVGDSIPTMALLSGVSPITAIGVYLLQKIVPPLSGNLFTFDYHITGSWQEPILNEVAHEPAKAQ
jgi:uncharacterized protein YhdP